MKYIFDLDEHFEDLWYELERIQDGDLTHQIIIEADNRFIAAGKLCSRLETFFENRLQEGE